MSDVIADKLAYDDEEGMLTVTAYDGAPVHLSGVDAVVVEGECMEWMRHEPGSFTATLDMAAPVRLEERGAQTVALVGDPKP